MAVILNASTSSGFIQTADTSGVLTLQSNGTNALSVSSSNLQFNSGYGSVATAYGCRAWVNFNGTGTVAIRASGNVSSITDNGTGNYTVNFTNAMPDANYAANYSAARPSYTASDITLAITAAPTTSALQITTMNGAGTAQDNLIVSVSVFR